MKNFLRELWIEVRLAARQAPRLYFAPLVGAVRHTRVVLRQIRRENKAGRGR